MIKFARHKNMYMINKYKFQNALALTAHMDHLDIYLICF